MPHATQEQNTAFISRWETSGAAEHANYQMFLSELCGISGVPRPDPPPPDPAKNRYVFDRSIAQIKPDGTSAPNYIDLYKARRFVCETKRVLSADASPDELAKPTSPQLLLTIGQDPETLAAYFGRKNKKRTDQITGICATLKALGHIA